MKKMGRKWKLLCAGLVAAGVLVAGVPGEQMPVAEAMYSVKDAEYHYPQYINEQMVLLIINIFIIETQRRLFEKENQSDSYDAIY